MDDATRDEMERRGDSLLDEERFRKSQAVRDLHRDMFGEDGYLANGEAVYLVSRDQDCVRVSCSGLYALSVDTARNLANAILDQVGHIEGAPL